MCNRKLPVTEEEMDFEAVKIPAYILSAQILPTYIHCLE